MQIFSLIQVIRGNFSIVSFIIVVVVVIWVLLLCALLPHWLEHGTISVAIPANHLELGTARFFVCVSTKNKYRIYHVFCEMCFVCVCKWKRKPVVGYDIRYVNSWMCDDDEMKNKCLAEKANTNVHFKMLKDMIVSS